MSVYIYTHIYIYIHTQRNVNSYVQMTLTHTHKPLEASLLDFYFFRRYAHVLCVLLVHCDSCNSKRRLPAFSDGNGSLQLVADVSKRQMHETMFIASQVSQPVRRITGLGCTDFLLLLAYVCEYNGLRCLLGRTTSHQWGCTNSLKLSSGRHRHDTRQLQVPLPVSTCWHVLAHA